MSATLLNLLVGVGIIAFGRLLVRRGYDESMSESIAELVLGALRGWRVYRVHRVEQRELAKQGNLFSPGKPESRVSYLYRRYTYLLGHFVGSLVRVAGQGVRSRRLKLPSPSQGLLSLAERRLPEQLSSAEKQRWAQEMRADVASLPRRRRLKVAYRAWRKGAPKMPVGTDLAAPITGGD